MPILTLFLLLLYDFIQIDYIQKIESHFFSC